MKKSFCCDYFLSLSSDASACLVFTCFMKRVLFKMWRHTFAPCPRAAQFLWPCLMMRMQRRMCEWLEGVKTKSTGECVHAKCVFLRTRPNEYTLKGLYAQLCTRLSRMRKMRYTRVFSLVAFNPQFWPHMWVCFDFSSPNVGNSFTDLL